MTAAEKIKEIRKANGMNMSQFSKHIGISHTLLASIEYGDRKVSLKTAVAISKAFGIKIKSLLDDSIENYYNTPSWTRLEIKQPPVGIDVLVLLDYTLFNGTKRILIAHVHFTDEPIEYGGPNSLTGSGKLTGLYFSLPAIVKPGIVTHWMSLPEFPIS